MPHPDNNQNVQEEYKAYIPFPAYVDYEGIVKDIVKADFDERLQVLEEKFEKAFPMTSDIIILPKPEDINRILEGGING